MESSKGGNKMKEPTREEFAGRQHLYEAAWRDWYEATHPEPRVKTTVPGTVERIGKFISNDRWYYEDEEINGHSDLDPMCTDIVYCITYTDGSLYIGKKTIRSMSVLPVLKTKTRDDGNIITRHILRDEEGKIIVGKAARKTARARGLKAKAELYEEVVTDKPFMGYEGSSKETEGYVIARKDIIYQCAGKKTATYLEAMLLFNENAIFDDQYLNSNILGTMFDNSLDDLIETEKKC